MTSNAANVQKKCNQFYGCQDQKRAQLFFYLHTQTHLHTHTHTCHKHTHTHRVGGGEIESAEQQLQLQQPFFIIISGTRWQTEATSRVQKGSMIAQERSVVGYGGVVGPKEARSTLSGWSAEGTVGNGYDRNSIAIAYNFTFGNYTLNYFPM